MSNTANTPAEARRLNLAALRKARNRRRDAMAFESKRRNRRRK